MTTLPRCERCGQPKRQEGRYADWTCPCCDHSARCPHVSALARFKRRLAGRKV